MEQETSTGKNSSGISRTGKRKWGYDCAQVDAFLERAHALYESENAQLNQQEIQNISFDLCKGGYDIAQVDAALSRLERAVVDKRTTWELSHDGRIAWKAQTEALYHQIAQHAERNPKQRFMPGAAKTPSYDRKQVDRLIDQIVDKVAAELGVDGADTSAVKDYVDLNSGTVTNVIFTQRRGKRGYDERQVDYFLNSCITLLGRLESYARVGDLMSEEESAAADASYAATEIIPPQNAAGGVSQSVAPLFAGAAGTASAVSAAMPADAAAVTVTGGTALHEENSFAQLHKAEQEIFAAPVSKPTMPSIPPIMTPAERPAEQPTVAVKPVFSLSALVSESSSAEATQAIPPISEQGEQSVQNTPTTSSTQSPTLFASQPVTPSEEAASSLAALAHLAQVTQSSSIAESENSLPPMPKLSAKGVPALDLEQSMSIPVVPPLPEPPAAMTQSSEHSYAKQEEPKTAQSDSVFAAPEETAVPVAPAVSTETVVEEKKDEAPKSVESSSLFPPLFPNMESLNVDIPDLSFPAFDMDTRPVSGAYSNEEENR